MTTPTKRTAAYALGYAAGRSDAAALCEGPSDTMITRRELAALIRALKPKPHVPARIAPKES